MATAVAVRSPAGAPRSTGLSAHPLRCTTSNRRVQRAELTDVGTALFDRRREVAVRHDHRLRSGLTDDETALLAELLDKLLAGRSATTGPDARDSPGNSRTPRESEVSTAAGADAL